MRWAGSSTACIPPVSATSSAPAWSRQRAGYRDLHHAPRARPRSSSTQNRDSTVWTPRPADPELEAEFLRRMLVKLGADQTRASPQVAAASVAPGAPGASPVASDRTRMVGAGGSQGLVVRERVRPRLAAGRARPGPGRFLRSKIAIVRKGVYYVRYIDPEVEAKGSAQPGLLARLFKFGDKRATSAQQYRVKVAGQGGRRWPCC